MAYDEYELRVAIVDLFFDGDDCVPARKVGGVWRESRIGLVDDVEGYRIIRRESVARNVRERIEVEKKPPANRVDHETVKRMVTLVHLGYQQTEIAELFGVTRKTVRRYAGKMDPLPKKPPKPRRAREPRVVARCPFCMSVVESKTGAHECITIDNRVKRTG